MEVIQELLNNIYTLIALAGAILALLVKMLGHLARAFAWHDKHFVRKRLTRLKAIRSSASGNPKLTEYIDGAIQLEAFRVASGINTSPAKMTVLLQLMEDGLWRPEQIRRVAKFLSVVPGNPTPQLEVLWIDKFGACSSAISAAYMLITGVVISLKLVFVGQSVSTLVGLAVFAVSMAATVFFATDLLDYILVKRVEKHQSLSAQTPPAAQSE